MTTGSAHSKTILLVDDDKDDREFFQDALSEVATDVVLFTAENGIEALKILRQASDKPGVIFLDLNMPLKNGYECLAELKADEQLKHIPAVIISTSLQPETAEQVYQDGASLYIVKPNSFPELRDVLARFAAINWQIPLSTTKESFIFKL